MLVIELLFFLFLFFDPQQFHILLGEIMLIRSIQKWYKMIVLVNTGTSFTAVMRLRVRERRLVFGSQKELLNGGAAFTHGSMRIEPMIITCIGYGICVNLKLKRYN